MDVVSNDCCIIKQALIVKVVDFVHFTVKYPDT